MNVPEALSRKVGPLPVGAWIIALVGGVGVAVVIRRGASDSAAADEAYEKGEQAGYESVAAGDAGAGGEGPGLTGAAYSSPTGPAFIDRPVYITQPTPAAPAAPKPSTTTPPPKPRKPRTNAEWRRLVHAKLSGRGYRRALVETSMDRWFAGKRLTSVQRNVIDEAIARIGQPPHPPRRKHRPGNAREDVTATPSRYDNGTDTNPGRFDG